MCMIVCAVQDPSGVLTRPFQAMAAAAANTNPSSRFGCLLRFALLGDGAQRRIQRTVEVLLIPRAIVQQKARHRIVDRGRRRNVTHVLSTHTAQVELQHHSAVLERHERRLRTLAVGSLLGSAIPTFDAAVLHLQ